MKQLKAFLLLLFAALSWHVQADNYTFRQPEKARALFGCSVNSLFEDNEGYLWIGTDNGLYRYDGYEMLHLTQSTPSRIPEDQHVNRLQEDASHHLWIAAFGSSTYIVLNERREHVDAQEYLASLGIGTNHQYLIHTDTEGNLWRITEDSICYYDFTQQQHQSYSTPGPIHASSHNISVQVYDGTLYILDGRLLRIFNQRQNIWHEENLDLPLPTIGNGTQSLLLSDIYVDGQGGVWVYSLFSERILYRDPKTLKWQPIVLPQEGIELQNSIRRILQDETDGVWIATNHRGLFLYHPESGQIEHFCHGAGQTGSLASDNVNTLIVDSHHTLWLAYFKNGISFCQPDLDLLHGRAQQCTDITAIYADANGERWIGTDGRGLWHEFPDGRIVQFEQIPNLTVTDLQRDSLGSLWIASYDHGLYRIDAHGILHHYDSSNGVLPHDGMQRIVIDSEGRIYACSAFGPFYCFDPVTEKSRIIKDNQNQDLMGQAITYDPREDRILFATFYGLWVYDVKTGNGYRMLGLHGDSQPFPVYQFSNILMDDFLPLVWMTYHDGISVWDTQADSLYLISQDQGLSSFVQAIRQDCRHNVWASTGQGLSMIRASRNMDSSWEFVVRNFLSIDNANNNLFNPYAGAATAQGEMLFGSPQGYTEFDSRALLSQADEPLQPRVSYVLLGDSVLFEEQLLHLSYQDHPLTFTFYTGNPLNAVNTRFSYRIVGLQDSWIETTDNSITLLTLPPGKYTLEVRAMGNNGEWGEATSLEMRVSPPWWMSMWMTFVYFLLIVAFLILIVWISNIYQRRKALVDRKMLIRQQQSRLAEMKLQFFTDISHDLRTPLTLIISPLEQLLKEKLPESVNHRLQLMYRNADTLLSEINTLLDFRKLDAGAEQLRLCQPTDVIAFIHEQCDQYYDVARDRKMQFRVQDPTEPVVMSFDKDKLRKILYNLLSNAFKHAPNASLVELRIEKVEATGDKPEELQICVSDQGPGVPDAEKNKIFELFYQSGGNNPKPGSGIGLHIAKQFVQLHGGRIWVEDNKPQGAVFGFTMPISISQPCDNAMPTGNAISQKCEDEKPVTAVTTPTKYSILVVDDNQDLCHFIEESLANEYIVHCAFNGQEALDILEKENITLVVSDVMMPGISGLELCNRIKSDLRYSHIPVILLTARTADQSVLEGLQQGADDYLTKPFNVDRLKLRIAKFIEWSQSSHQSFQQQPEIEPRQITITSLDEKFIQKALDEVNDHLQDAEFGVEELASAVCMSRSQLYKKLMAVTGKSPIDFIRTLRMKRAKALLEQSQMQVSEVAYQVGYNTLKTFSENFKQEFGITPTEWIKSRHH